MNLKSFIREGIGAADIAALLSNGSAFSELIDRLANIFSKEDFNKVVCIEGKGLVLGAAVAYKLGKGVVMVRNLGKLKNATFRTAFVDYSGKERIFEMLEDALEVGEKVILVDDWVQTGETLKATIRLIEMSKGEVVGVAAFMDDSKQETKDYLGKYNYRYLEAEEKKL